MKLNTSRLLIILVVLIGAFVIIRMTRQTSRSKSFKSELVNFETGQADRVEIISPGVRTVLTRSDGNWQVATDQGIRPAMTGAVTSMLATLNTIKPSRLAARHESKWKDFSVDSTGNRVIVYDGDDKLTDIVLGRFGVEGQRSFYTYVRLSGDEDVYVVDNFMKMSISTRPDDYRDHVLARVGRDSLTTIALNYPDSSLILSLEGDQWVKDAGPADSTAVADYIRSLSILTSKNFVESAPDRSPDINVTYGFSNGAEIQISAYQDDAGWILTSSTNPLEAWKDSTVFDKVFVPVRRF